MKCEKCQTENGYPSERDGVWKCRKCLHKTKLPEEEKLNGQESTE